MEIALPVKRSRNRKKVPKKEPDDYDYNNRNLLEKAVDTIMDDSSYSNGPIPAKNYKKKKFIEPEADSLIFQKISVPQTMRSVYWKYFGFPADDYGEILSKRIVICTLCSCHFVYLQNTSNLKAHLSHKHKPQYHALVADREEQMPTTPNCKNMVNLPKKKKKSDIPERDRYRLVDANEPSADNYSICVQGENEGEHAIINVTPHVLAQAKGMSRAVIQQDTKSLIDLIVDFVILDLQPPFIVNSHGFRHLLSSLTTTCEIPTETSIIQDFIPKMYDTLKNNMYNDITAINLTDNVFSLAIEHWKVEDNVREYVSYYINYLHNEEIFATKLLHTFQLDNDQIHSEVYHQEMLNIICSSWNIKMSNVKAIVLSTDNDVITKVIVSTGVCVIPCLVHTISDMCIRAFQSDTHANIIKKCRAIASKIYNKNNYAILVEIDQLNTVTGESASFLCLDNPKVWTTTLNMLEDLNATRSKLDIVLELGENENQQDADLLTEQEWNILSKLVDICNPIRVTVSTLSEEKPALASLILPLYLQLVNHHLKVQPDDCPVTVELKSFFVDFLEKKYAAVEPTLQVCTALDPRVKKLPYIEDIEVFELSIKDMLVALEPSSESTKYYNDVIEQEENNKKKSRLSGMEFLLGDVTSPVTYKQRSKGGSHEDNIIYEIEQYKKSPVANLRTCPLKWWKSHCNKFPNLFSLATKYNCIPANALPYYKIESKVQNSYFEKRKTLSYNCQHVLNHMLFLHHNYSV